MPVTFSVRGPIALPSAGPAYQGPGDVVAGALMGWSLRAWSAATAGTKAVKLIRADTVQADISTLANGNLDTGNAFFNGSTYKVVTLYDQASGSNTYDVTQPTDANRPIFTLNALNGFPIMTFVIGSQLWLKYSGAAFTQSQPLCHTAVARPGINAANSEIISCNNAEVDLSFGNSGNADIFAGTSVQVTLATVKFYTLQSLAKSGTNASKISASGTVVTGDAGTNTLSSSNISIGSYNGTVLFGDMDFVEGGIWGSDTSASFASLDTNQTAYWGPF
jgi:hypothetical protein